MTRGGWKSFDLQEPRILDAGAAAVAAKSTLPA